MTTLPAVFTNLRGPFARVHTARMKRVPRVWKLSSLISYGYRLLTWEESDKSGIMESLLAPEAVARKPQKKLLDQVPDVTLPNA